MRPLESRRERAAAAVRGWDAAVITESWIRERVRSRSNRLSSANLLAGRRRLLPMFRLAKAGLLWAGICVAVDGRELLVAAGAGPTIGEAGQFRKFVSTGPIPAGDN